MRSLKTVSKYLRKCSICHVKVDGIVVLDRSKKTKIENQFIRVLTTSLQKLRWLGISLAGKKDEQITATGKAISYFKSFEIDVRYVQCLKIKISSFFSLYRRNDSQNICF